jgi:hypothetical protein
MNVELAPLDAPPEMHPIAWVDTAGQVWPLPQFAPIHIGVKYLFSQKELADAVRAQNSTVVTGDVSIMADPAMFDSDAQPVIVTTDKEEVKRVRTVRKNVTTAFGTA